MKSDLYTKAVLTVIAFALVMIVCNQYVNPNTTAEAQWAFAGVQFSVASNEFSFFDARTGDLWNYYKGFDSDKWFWRHRTLTKFGQPMPEK